MKWYGEQVKTKYELASLSGLVAASITLESEIVKRIREMNIIDTGRYMGSITYRAYKERDLARHPAHPGDGVQSLPDKWEAIVGTNVSYASFLEYGAGGRPPRPAIRKAFDESKDKLISAFTRQFVKMA